MLMPVREGGNHGGMHGGMARLPSSVSNFNYFLFPSPHSKFIQTILQFAIKLTDQSCLLSFI
jgi:hypothetical protein